MMTQRLTTFAEDTSGCSIADFRSSFARLTLLGEDASSSPMLDCG
jgi:hypothetical protein